VTKDVPENTAVNNKVHNVGRYYSNLLQK